MHRQVSYRLFQHTAARRRLLEQFLVNGICRVSTHSRPKAAVAIMKKLLGEM